MVENLYLHPVERGIDAHRRTNTDAVVDALGEEPELEAQDEIAVFPDGVEVPRTAVGGRHVDRTVQRHIIGRIARPLVERTPVEEHLVARGGLVGREGENGCRRQFVDPEVSEGDGSTLSGQFDTALCINRLAGRAEVRHHGIFGNFHAILHQRDAIVHDLNIERIPRPRSVVGNGSGGLAVREPRPGGTAQADQRHRAHGHAGLALGTPFDPEFEILVFLFSPDRRGSLGGKFEQAVRSAPIGSHRLVGGFAELRHLTGGQPLRLGRIHGHGRPSREPVGGQHGESVRRDLTEQTRDLIHGIPGVGVGFGEFFIDLVRPLQSLADSFAAGHRVALGNDGLHGRGGRGGGLRIVEVFGGQHQCREGVYARKVAEQFGLHGGRRPECESLSVKLVAADRGHGGLRSQVGIAHQGAVGEHRIFGSDPVKDIGHGRIFDRQQGGESRVAVPGAEPVEQAGDSLLRAALRQHGIVTRRGFRGLHITCDGAIPPVGGELPRGADQRRLDRGRVGLIGSVEQCGEPIHVLRLGDEGKRPVSGGTNLRVGGAEQCEHPVCGRGHAARSGQLERRNECRGIILRKQPPHFGVDLSVECKEGFHRGTGMGAFERPGQRP